ncbi:MAG TPA: YicC/YloC family endoribonuclease [Bacillota bacterium]
MTGPRSMTGFGRGSHTGVVYRVEVEIRSVNHRYREIVARVPRELPGLEEPVRTEVAARIARGRVDVFVTAQPLPGARPVRVDTELARRYHGALEQLRQELALPAPVDLALLAGLPGVVGVDEASSDIETCWLDVRPALDQALAALTGMRDAEGRALAADLAAAADRLAGLVETVAGRAPQVVEEYRARLTQRVQALADEVHVDPERLAAEVVLFADRADIHEELVRLRSHLGQFRAALGLDEPVGRKLDFLLQEMNREVNTIGAKAHDAGIASTVVEMKAEIERMREQVQNVE